MFRNTIIPPEMLQDMTPGNLWQPESAARYNAVNDLLRNSDDLPELPAAAAYIAPKRLTVPVLNVDSKAIHCSRGAEIIVRDSAAYEGTKEYVRVKNLPDSGVIFRDTDILWGVMENTINPGEIGSIIIGGLAIAFTEFDSTQQGREFRYVWPESGYLKATDVPSRAEVLWHPGKVGNYHVPVLLNGPAAAAVPRVMFQVTHDYFKNEIKINKGYVDNLDVTFGMAEIKEHTMPMPENTNWDYYIFLVLKFEGVKYTGYEYVMTSRFKDEKLYEVRKSLPWPIAKVKKKTDGYSRISLEIEQLWSGGMIPLNTRYYLV